MSNIREIEVFYYSLQTAVESIDKRELDFCMILNKDLVESMMKEKDGKRVLMGLALSYFEQRIQGDKNPLLQQYDIQLHQKIAYY